MRGWHRFFRPEQPERYGCCSQNWHPRKESGFEPWLAAKDFGKEAASLAFSYCPEVVMPDATSVVVLQDRTVGTVMVPKQT